MKRASSQGARVFAFCLRVASFVGAITETRARLAEKRTLAAPLFRRSSPPNAAPGDFREAAKTTEGAKIARGESARFGVRAWRLLASSLTSVQPLRVAPVLRRRVTHVPGPRVTHVRGLRRDHSRRRSCAPRRRVFSGALGAIGRPGDLAILAPLALLAALGSRAEVANADLSTVCRAAPRRELCAVRGAWRDRDRPQAAGAG